MMSDKLFVCSIVWAASVVHVLVNGCDHCECDKSGALSSCQVAPPCTPEHDLVVGMTNCDERGMKCCRATCDGPGSMCVPKKARCASGLTELGPRTCKRGYKCIKTARRLKTKLQLS